MSEVTRAALVTGGSRGIGRAICVKLASMGMNIAVNYSGSEAAAAETVALCEAQGVKAIAVQADVADAAAVDAMFKTVMETFGRVDVLVNNAGVTRDGLMMRMSEEDFDKVLDTNLKGAFLCCKAATRPMMKQRYGRIINMSSVTGLRGNVGQANYAASKAGLLGLTKTIAKELVSRGITANAVCPGLIETDMTRAMPEAARTAILESIPMKRAGAPEEIANAVAFFASEASAYVTGQVLSVDGGMAV